jgi:hypothetical protein
MGLSNHDFTDQFDYHIILQTNLTITWFYRPIWQSHDFTDQFYCHMILQSNLTITYDFTDHKHWKIIKIFRLMPITINHLWYNGKYIHFRYSSLEYTSCDSQIGL